MNSEIKRELMLDNVKNPYHKEIKDDTYIMVNTNNESCIDNITLFIKFKDGIVDEIYFDGEACAITTSTTSIMIKTLEKKKVDEAINIIDNYYNMIDEQSYDEEVLEEAIIYDEIYKQPNRKKCALLPWNGIRKVLEEYKNSH